MPSELLARATPGRVLTVFADDVEQAVLTLSHEAEEAEPIATLIMLDWTEAPSLTQELREIEGALAKAVGSLWPNWHCSALEKFDKHALDTQMETQLRMARAAYDNISTGWFRKAWTNCEKGIAPLVENTVSAEQVRQLTLALDPSRPVFSLSVQSSTALRGRVRGLARASEWLAKQTEASVILLLPEPWKDNNELDPVNYGALDFRSEPLPRPPLVQSSLQNPQARESTKALPTKPQEVPKGNDKSGEPTVAVQPNPGKPHAHSQAEIKLAEWLSRDKLLRNVFAFNQHLDGFHGQKYTVDLIDRSSGLIIEVDGHSHRREEDYENDRERDYQLLMNGHTVLRITNAQIFTDTERVLVKIRNMVQLLQSQK